MERVYDLKRCTSKKILHGEGIRLKEVHIQKVIAWKGYTAQKGTYPKINFMERIYDTIRYKLKLISWRGYMTQKIHTQKVIRRRMYTTQKFTPKILFHGKGTKLKKVYTQTEITWRGYTTRKARPGQPPTSPRAFHLVFHLLSAS